MRMSSTIELLGKNWEGTVGNCYVSHPQVMGQWVIAFPSSCFFFAFPNFLHYQYVYSSIYMN